MHRSLFRKSCAAAALALALSATAASAAGLLGTRYVSASYDFTLPESDAYDDGKGISLFFNKPLLDTVDIGFEYRARSRDGTRADVPDFSDHRVRVVATGFMRGEREDIFVRVGLGLGKVDEGDRETTNLAWSGVVGTEYTLSESAVLQPYVGWNDVIRDGRSVSFIYGLTAVYHASDTFSVTGQLEGDEHYNVTLSFGALYRF